LEQNQIPSSVPPSSEGLPPLKGWQKTFAALQNPNYRYFFTGQTVSLIGTWARQSALAWLAWKLTGSEFLLGLVATLNALPILLFSTYSGSLADRVSKLKIFKLTSWFSMLSSLSLALLLFHGPVGIGILLIFSTLWGTATAFEMPARQSLMVELVGRKDLVNSIALNSAMVNSTRVIGPAIGMQVYAFGGDNETGAAWCFFVDALSYLAVLYAIGKMKPSPTHVKPVKADFKYILEGFRYLRSHALLAQTVSLLSIMTLGGWSYISQLPAFVDTRLHLHGRAYGLLLAMTGLGACVAALTVATMGAALVRARTLYAGIGIYCLFVVLFGLEKDPIAAALFLFLTGFGLILFFSVGNSMIQTHAPNELRGRLMGVWALVFGGGMPFGSFWMGVVAQRTSSGVSMQVGGLFCALGALVVYLFFRKSKA
jgi:MFS family permease